MRGSIPPVLVILELMISDIPGAEVLRALKNDPQLRGVFVVILSRTREEVDRIVSIELGADDYVTKPFTMRELPLRIKAYSLSCTLAEQIC